jgi:hypothetical protein
VCAAVCTIRCAAGTSAGGFLADAARYDSEGLWVDVGRFDHHIHRRSGRSRRVTDLGVDPLPQGLLGDRQVVTSLDCALFPK